PLLIEENAFCSSRLIIADYQPSHFPYFIVLRCSSQFSDQNRHYSFRVVEPVTVGDDPVLAVLMLNLLFSASSMIVSNTRH
ncbi:hypothetical protein, partial [Lactiplantibacillus pentosus]